MDKATLKLCVDKIAQLKQQVHESINQVDKSLLDFEEAEDLDEIDQSNNLSEISRLKNLRSQYDTRLLQIQSAEQRIGSKKFGVCIACEEDIPKNRLIANPLSIRCLECQEDLETVQKENKMRKIPGFNRDDAGTVSSSEDDE